LRGASRGFHASSSTARRLRVGEVGEGVEVRPHAAAAALAASVDLAQGCLDGAGLLAGCGDELLFRHPRRLLEEVANLVGGRGRARPVFGITSEAVLAVEEQAPGFPDWQVAVSVFEPVQAAVAVADTLQAEHDLGAANDRGAAEEIVDRELDAGLRLAAVGRHHERERVSVAPGVEDFHQVDGFTLGVRVAGVRLVPGIDGDDVVAACFEECFDGSKSAEL
jgi:hypothetical protein